MIPEGWTSQTLERLASVKRGKFTPRPRNDPRYYGGQMPFVQTGDVTSAGKYLTEYSQTLNDDGVSVSKVFPPDTILITIAANIGHTAITTFDVACPDSVVGIQPIEDRCDVYWLKDVLETKRDELDGLSTQNAQKNINLEVLKPLLIVTPPLPEQRRIAEILSTWDGAIETVERLIANAAAQKKALMQTLLTGKKRLPGFSGEWAHQKIGSISNRVNARNDGTQLPVLTISSTAGFVRQDEKYSRFMAGKSVESYVMLRRGEFAYNKGNSKTFEFGCVLDLDGYDCGLVPHVYVCFKLKKGYGHRFYKAIFEADYLAAQLGRLVNTGVRNNGLLNITAEQFLGTSVPVPPLDEQDAIASIMETASGEVYQLRRQLTALRQEKSALMQQLLTGKRRVKITEENEV